jgi:hypothetical protein
MCHFICVKCMVFSNINHEGLMADISTADIIKIAVFWVVAPCSLVERFRDPCCLHYRGDHGFHFLYVVYIFTSNFNYLVIYTVL